MGQGLDRGDEGRPEPGGHSGRGERGSLPGRAGRMCCWVSACGRKGVQDAAQVLGPGLPFMEVGREGLVLTCAGSSGQAVGSSVEGDRVSE